MKRYLAVDIGASSGRHIVGYLENGKIVSEEVYRFSNGAKRENGHLIWDIHSLLAEVKKGIAAAMKKYGRIDCLSLDTWAVDYVLMNGDTEILPCYAYRDSRTEKVIEKVHSLIPFQKLFARTGIQFQPFNTIYQLYEDKLSGRLEKATDFLMLPEYLLYKLTGVKSCEYTNATATGLVNASLHTYDPQILTALGLPLHLFNKEIDAPGKIVGKLLPAVASEVGGTATVILCATHDTASAVLAAPIEGNCASPYISSGTWSLFGIEQEKAHTDAVSMKNNFSNEGSVNGIFRYQKNIMGLWMLQSARKELGLSFAEAEVLARNNICDALVNCNDEIFLSPASMCEAVRKRAGELSDGQLLYCIYNSLAHCYKQALCEMQDALGLRFQTLNIIGGGSRDTFLNALTAKAAGVQVIAGPTEATALGNLLVQMIAGGEIGSVTEGRAILQNTFSFQKYN